MAFLLPHEFVPSLRVRMLIVLIHSAMHRLPAEFAAPTRFSFVSKKVDAHHAHHKCFTDLAKPIVRAIRKRPVSVAFFTLADVEQRI